MIPKLLTIEEIRAVKRPWMAVLYMAAGRRAAHSRWPWDAYIGADWSGFPKKPYNWEMQR